MKTENSTRLTYMRPVIGLISLETPLLCASGSTSASGDDAIIDDEWVIE